MPTVLHPDGRHVEVPISMTRDPDYPAATHSPQAFDRLRTRHDFEFWCATCCNIHDKATGRIIPFKLNPPQRHVAAMLEEDRLAGRPIRLIMLKARQWGGSTLIQMYMAWIQCTQRHNWNSLICAHVKDTSATIRGMYTEMLARYPEAMWMGDDDSRPGFRPYERSVNVRELPGRGCRVTVASSENHEAVRGGDYAMAHLSEVAFWADTPSRSPAQFIRAVCGSIDIAPLTMVVMESTANGVGNYFHSEWLRAKAGLSDKRPVFIPWHMIPMYQTPVDPAGRDALLASLDPYERELMEVHGCTLEQVNWYRRKRREYPDHAQMKAEYPTTDVEAFSNTGYGVFDGRHIERLRLGCRPPLVTGEMTGPVAVGPGALSALRFAERPDGRLKVWSHPACGDTDGDGRYLVVVDVGGRSRTSDWSVIAVFDRVATPGALELAAQWRGHCDHDILAWMAAAVARWYGNACLVYESNTLETDNTEGDPSQFILDEVASAYGNLYYRVVGEGGGSTLRPGFHTNRSTKSMALTRLNAALRDGTLIERDADACNELVTYRNMPNGSQGAAPGHHDDLLITRAIALAVLPTLPAPGAYTAALAFAMHDC